MNFRFIPGPGLGDTRAIYSRQDFSLDYHAPDPTEKPAEPPNLAGWIDQRLGIKSGPCRFFLTADWLTLDFDDRKRKLVGLDAYTNEQLWTSCSMTLPAVSGRGSLFVEGVPDEEDRDSLPVVPRYELAPDRTWLRIVLADAVPAQHYEVGRRLIVGLSDEGIADIFLLEPEFRP